jgi:hypothetical protein
MSQIPEEFDSLRRLLALKRFESPPPGYFRELSPRIRARVETEIEAAALRPWWRRMFPLSVFDRILATPNAFTVAGLVLVGISLALVLNSDRPASRELGGIGRTASGNRSAAGFPDPVSLTPATSWTTVSEPAPAFTLQLNFVDGLTNHENPPSSLFAVPAIRGFRVNYSLDQR